MDKAPFVERRFDLDGSELVARFHMPAKAPGGELGVDRSHSEHERLNAILAARMEAITAAR